MATSTSTNSTPHRKQAQDRRASVLHLAPSMGADFPSREVFDMALQTHRAGWRCLIASAGGPLTLEAERAALRHTVIPISKQNPFSVWRARRILEALIDREHPVLIHAHGPETMRLAAKTATSRHLPFLIDLTEPLPVTAANRKALTEVIARGGKIRVPSRFMLDRLTNDFGIDPARLKLIHPGIDLDRHEAARVTSERIKKITDLWRLPEQAALIIMATPYAGGGHEIALEALSRITNRDVYMVFVGLDGPGRTAIGHKIAARNLEGKVILPEICEDWTTACWLATLVIAPNATPRGQAAEILAAQALGRPVIVTDCGANVELVAGGQTAWVVPPDDADALTKALETALAIGAERRIDLAIKTRAFITDRFSMETWRDAFFNFYDDLLEEKNASQKAAA